MGVMYDVRIVVSGVHVSAWDLPLSRLPQASLARLHALVILLEDMVAVIVEIREFAGGSSVRAADRRVSVAGATRSK